MKTLTLMFILILSVILEAQIAKSQAIDGIKLANQFDSLQAAHDALPPSGGTVFVSSGTSIEKGLVISKPIHLIFDLGAFTYHGQADAIRVNAGVRGVIIEGSGNAELNSPASGSAVLVGDPAANGLNALANPNIVIRNMAFTGPGKGTGVGIYITGNGFLLENTQTTSFGGDGTVIDGKRGNSNSGILLHARSYRNGADGFKVFGADANLISWIGTDAQANAGKNYVFDHVMCQSFMGLHSQPPTDRTSISFIGSSANWGSLYIEPVKPFAAACLEFDSTSKNNNLFLMNCRKVKDIGVHNQWDLAAPDK